MAESNHTFDLNTVISILDTRLVNHERHSNVDHLSAGEVEQIPYLAFHVLKRLLTGAIAGIKPSVFAILQHPAISSSRVNGMPIFLMGSYR